jgi:curved DNA-binding protein CbpA
VSNGKAKGRKKTTLLQPEETPYDILGISEAATNEEIRRAYLQKVRLSPPERDPETFQQVRKAYGLLTDSEKKRELDLSLFKTESLLGVDSGMEYNFKAIAQQRLFQILLSSSDFYVKDFSKHFHTVEERIENLQ